MLNETNVQATESAAASKTAAAAAASKTAAAASKTAAAASKTAAAASKTSAAASKTAAAGKRDSAELLAIVNQALAVFSMNAKDSAILTICALYEADNATRTTIERIASSAKYKRNYDKYRSTLIAIFDFARVDAKSFNAIFAGTDSSTVDGLPDYSNAAKKIWKLAESWINLQSSDGYLFMQAAQTANAERDNHVKK